MMTSAHNSVKTSKCRWCQDRANGCIMCISSADAVATSQPEQTPEEKKSERQFAQARNPDPVSALAKTPPPLTNVADDMPEAKAVEAEHPASAWDTSTDYGPRVDGSSWPFDDPVLPVIPGTQHDPSENDRTADEPE